MGNVANLVMSAVGSRAASLPPEGSYGEAIYFDAMTSLVTGKTTTTNVDVYCAGNTAAPCHQRPSKTEEAPAQKSSGGFFEWIEKFAQLQRGKPAAPAAAPAPAESRPQHSDYRMPLHR